MSIKFKSFDHDSKKVRRVTLSDDRGSFEIPAYGYLLGSENVELFKVVTKYTKEDGTLDVTKTAQFFWEYAAMFLKLRLNLEESDPDAILTYPDGVSFSTSLVQAIIDLITEENGGELIGTFLKIPDDRNVRLQKSKKGN